jgi:hypothetical protein
LQGIDSTPRYRINFSLSSIKVYKSYKGQSTEIGTFEYADPRLIDQILSALSKAGLEGIDHVELIDGTQT